jgi:HEAT repeat protein
VTASVVTVAEPVAPPGASPRPLRERLRDAEPGIRLGAAGDAYLAAAPPTACQAELALLLADPNEDARKLAALALGRIGPPAFSDLARALTAAQPAAVRAFACIAAGAHGPAAAPLVAPLCTCLKAPEEGVRSPASIALGRVGAAAVGPLSRVLDESNEAGTLIAAADAAGAIGKDAAPTSEALRRASGHPEPRVGLASVDALGRVSGRPASALPALVSATHSSNEDLRAEAVRRIGALQRDGHGAGKTLLSLGGDPSPKVRAASAIALALVGVRGDDLLSVLGRLLDDPDPQVRVCAAAAACHVREEARPLLPKLEALRRGAEPGVAAASSAACDAVMGKEAPKPPARVAPSA